MSQQENVNDIEFSTAFTIDKVVKDDGELSLLVGSGSPTVSTTGSIDEEHDFDHPVVATGSFSINGTDFYPCGSYINGPYDSGTQLRQFAQCYLYADANKVYAVMTNGYTSANTFTVQYVLESID